MLPRGAFLAATLLALHASGSEARADWLIAPFVGGTFRTETTLVVLQRTSGATRPIFGVSGLWLTDTIIGAEGSVAHAPGFFQRPNTLLVGSSVTTVGGNVVIAVPRALTRDSLRPYATAGVASVNASRRDVFGLFTQSTRITALTVGGGAIGFVSRRAGVRFDIRYVRSAERAASPLTARQEPPLSFSQATVGIVLRY